METRSLEGEAPVIFSRCLADDINQAKVPSAPPLASCSRSHVRPSPALSVASRGVAPPRPPLVSTDTAPSLMVEFWRPWRGADATLVARFNGDPSETSGSVRQLADEWRTQWGGLMSLGSNRRGSKGSRKGAPPLLLRARQVPKALRPER